MLPEFQIINVIYSRLLKYVIKEQVLNTIEGFRLYFNVTCFIRIHVQAVHVMPNGMNTGTSDDDSQGKL